MYQDSRVIIFRFNGKTQRQMFLLFYSRHVGVSIQSSINLGETFFTNNAGMTNRLDLHLSEVVCLSITYHTPDS